MLLLEIHLVLYFILTLGSFYCTRQMNRIAIQASLILFSLTWCPFAQLSHMTTVQLEKCFNFERANHHSLMIEAASLDILRFNHLLCITYSCPFHIPKYRENSV